MRKIINKPLKICIICLEPYFKDGDLGYRQWNKRKYCSRKCMGIATTGSNNPYKGSMRAEKHPRWIEKDISYHSLHGWLYFNLGSANDKECVYCGSNKNLQWASISHKAQRDLNDYIPLCGKCHFAYDKQQLRDRDYHGRFI